MTSLTGSALISEKATKQPLDGDQSFQTAGRINEFTV
jgi:hypothetical protein